MSEKQFFKHLNAAMPKLLPEALVLDNALAGCLTGKTINFTFEVYALPRNDISIKKLIFYFL